MDLPRIELGPPRCKRSILPLDYRPNNLIRPSQFLSFPKKLYVGRRIKFTCSFSKNVERKQYLLYLKNFIFYVHKIFFISKKLIFILVNNFFFEKIIGGNPSAGSPTDTL